MKFLKLSCASLAFAATGFILGFILAGAGFIALWWSFPGDWQPLVGVDTSPQELLALDAEKTTYLLRIADGTLLTCLENTCAPEQTDWSTADTRCNDSTRPTTASWLPVLAVRGARTILACERSYTDVGRTVYVAEISGKGTYMSSGVSLIPTDAGVIGVGIAGGVVGSGLVILTGMVIWIGRKVSRRHMVE